MCPPPKASTPEVVAPPTPVKAPSALTLPDGAVGTALAQARTAGRSGLASLKVSSPLTIPAPA